MTEDDDTRAIGLRLTAAGAAVLALLQERDAWRERAERAEALSPAAARLARAVVAWEAAGRAWDDAGRPLRAEPDDPQPLHLLAMDRANRERYLAEADVIATWGEP